MKRKLYMVLVCILLVSMITGLIAGCSGKKDPREKYLKHLNEKYADYTEVPYGLDITKKTDIVSICYSTWFTKILSLNSNPPNITEILEGKYDWGSVTAFHYWAEPELGYYESDDKEVIRTHMTQLGEAGVDFIIIDNTNSSINWKKTNNWDLYMTRPCTAILDTIVEMRAEGLKTPYVVFWTKVRTTTGYEVVNATYEEFHAQEKWKDCFVYLEGKPLTLITHDFSMPRTEEFTYRVMMGLRRKLEVSEWSFLHIENIPSYDEDGFVEQMCVCCACQETYMSAPTAHGRNHGIFFYEQWKRAFEYRPKVVTLAWWNEWAAQRLEITSGAYAGEYHFTDAYTAEFSRDIEPMKGGHGDQYYQWMKEYIRAYKAGEECPRLVEEGY